MQIPFEALLPAEVRRMVAPDSNIAPPPLHRDSYARDRKEGSGLQHDNRSPSLPLSEEAAPPLGGTHFYDILCFLPVSRLIACSECMQAPVCRFTLSVQPSPSGWAPA